MLKLEDKTQRQVDIFLESLGREFEGRVPAQTVSQVGHDVLTDLLSDARFPDFVPVLARRYTREQLLLRVAPETNASTAVVMADESRSPRALRGGRRRGRLSSRVLAHG